MGRELCASDTVQVTRNPVCLGGRRGAFCPGGGGGSLKPGVFFSEKPAPSIMGGLSDLVGETRYLPSNPRRVQMAAPKTTLLF